jgi:hypothetical protein
MLRQIQELRIDYTDCNSTAGPQFSQIPESKVHSSFKHSNNTIRPQWKRTLNTTRPPWSGASIEETPVCTLQFDIPNDIGPPVYLYYRLTNFYQNHRRYVKSLDTDQLKGHFVHNSTIHDSSCNPIKTNHDGIAYYPCGLIANSVFNDTLNSPLLVSASGNEPAQTYRMTNKSIAWGSDASLYKKTEYTAFDVVPPPNWAKRYPNGYTPETLPDLSEYEEFQVWMRTAGLPTFSKLALRNDNETMTAGIYQMEIFDCKPPQLSCVHCPLTLSSLPCLDLRWYQERLDFHSICRRRKEQLLGHCLRGHWRPVHHSRGVVHSCPFDPTEVSLPLS